jgi:hypothetical protein
MAKLKLDWPVKTRAGRDAIIIATDLKNPTHPVAARVMTASGDEIVHHFTVDGQFNAYRESDDDLVNVPKRKQVWLNVHKNCAVYHFGSEADARDAVFEMEDQYDVIARLVEYEVQP